MRHRISAVLLLFLITASSAQAAPSSGNPGDEIGAESAAFKRRSVPVQAKETSPLKIELPSENEPLTPGVALKEFFVKEIRLEGVKEILLSELRPILKKFENQNLNLAKLNAIARNITQYYRLKGYITSRAFVPPQEVENGVVVIKVVEGRLGKVVINGNKLVKTDWLAGYVKMKTGEVIQYSKILQDLTRLNRNPDRQIRAALAPGAAPETSDILLDVKESRPYRFAYTFDDHGTRLSGRLRQGLFFQDSNLLGRDDVLYNNLTVSEGRDFLGEAVNYVYPVSPTGGRFIFSYAYSAVQLGKELKPLQIDGGANLWDLSYVQPVVDEANWSLDLDGGFAIKRIWSDLDGNANSRDRLSVVHFGPDVSVRDAWGTTNAKNDFVCGVSDFLGSDKDSFFADDLDISRVQPFFWNSVVVEHFQAQFSGDDLVSAQQIRAGGFDTVRGYEEGDSLGDYGFVESTEWRVPPYFIPKDFRVPGRKETFWEALQFLGFVDSASVHIHHPASGQDGDRKLVGMGFGVRFSLIDSVSAQVDCGWPVGDRSENGAGPRLHFGLTVPF